MAIENVRESHNSHSQKRREEKGTDGFVDGHARGNPNVGTHTPGQHARSETVREGSDGQKHENRQNPERDHVPGHMGYTDEDVEGVERTEGD
jgi:hypothetical protein